MTHQSRLCLSPHRHKGALFGIYVYQNSNKRMPIALPMDRTGSRHVHLINRPPPGDEDCEEAESDQSLYYQYNFPGDVAIGVKIVRLPGDVICKNSIVMDIRNMRNVKDIYSLNKMTFTMDEFEFVFNKGSCGGKYGDIETILDDTHFIIQYTQTHHYNRGSFNTPIKFLPSVYDMLKRDVESMILDMNTMLPYLNRACLGGNCGSINDKRILQRILRAQIHEYHLEKKSRQRRSFEDSLLYFKDYVTRYGILVLNRTLAARHYQPTSFLTHRQLIPSEEEEDFFRRVFPRNYRDPIASMFIVGCCEQMVDFYTP